MAWVAGRHTEVRCPRHLPPAVVAVAQPVHYLRDFGVAAKQCVLDVGQHLPAEILAQMRVEGLGPGCPMIRELG